MTVAFAGMLAWAMAGPAAFGVGSASAPTISGFTPKAGPVGKKVTVTGTGFTGATSVTLNGTAALGFKVVSDTTITAKVPSGALTGKLAVTTPGGSATSAKKFKVRPTITSLSPPGAPLGATVTVSGSAFTGATTVAFNGAAASFAVVDYSTIHAVVPGGATDGPVTVTTPGGTGTSSAGFIILASLLLNEVNANITGSHDLVELRALTAGQIGGQQLVQNPANSPTILATLPSLTVQTGDLIVIHLTPTAGIITETISKTECVDAACYLLAWDIAAGAANITYGDEVLAVTLPGGFVEDGAAIVRSTGQASGFPAELQALQAAGQWLPSDCTGIPCTYMTTPSAKDVSANWDVLGSSPTGNSLRRIFAADSNVAADFSVGAQTWGFPN